MARKHTCITPEIDQQIMDMYTHRVSLIHEADRYTIERIAEKLGIGKNTVWARVNGMLIDKTCAKSSYTEKLESRVRILEAIIREAKQGLFVTSAKLNRQPGNMMFGGDMMKNITDQIAGVEGEL